MPFACGGHTAYACSLEGEMKLSDYVIEFPKALELKTSLLGKSGLLSDKVRIVEKEDNVLPLSDTLYNDDALIFANIDCDWVRLRKRDKETGIIVRFAGYPNLALWSKPTADFVCIEPWLGLTDNENESLDITEKKTYKTIAPKAIFSLAIESIVE